MCAFLCNALTVLAKNSGLYGTGFTNADPRCAGKLDDPQGGGWCDNADGAGKRSHDGLSRNGRWIKLANVGADGVSATIGICEWESRWSRKQCNDQRTDKTAIFLQRSFCTVAYAHMHERICIFLRRVCMHLDRCFGHHACAGVYVKRVPWTSAYTFANTLATGCAYALMHVQFVRSALRERGWMGSSSQLKHLLLGLRGYFWEKER